MSVDLRVFGLAAVAAVAVLAAQCPALAADEITIGAPLPLTGALSPEGEKLKMGYELWLEELEKRGGISVGDVKHKVKLVYSDYQSKTPRAVQLAEKLISSDKVNFLFSPFGSGAIKAASSVAEKYGVPMMASTASSKEVYDQNYKNLFGLYTPNDTLTEPIADAGQGQVPRRHARGDPRPQRSLSAGARQEFKKSAEARGLQVVYFEKYAIGTLDHAAAITQIGAAKPDWIIATGYINDLILIRQQMADQKVTAKVITGINGPQYQEWIDAVGAVGNGVTTASWFHSSVRYKSDDLFRDTENFVNCSPPNTSPSPTSPRLPVRHRRHPADGDREGGYARPRQGAKRACQYRVQDVLRAGEIRARRPGQFLHAADLSDPGQESGRDLSRRDQAGRSAARGRTLMLAS